MDIIQESYHRRFIQVYISKSGMTNIFIKAFTFMLTALLDFFHSFKVADGYFGYMELTFSSC
jgi:hypothetical protein